MARLKDGTITEGSHKVNGKLEIAAGPNGGLAFPPNSFGGTGDTASIRWESRTGEDTSLIVQSTNEANDWIDLRTPATTGLRHNGQPVYSLAQGWGPSKIYRVTLFGYEWTSSISSSAWSPLWSYQSSHMYYDPTEWVPPVGTLQMRWFVYGFENALNTGAFALNYTTNGRDSIGNGQVMGDAIISSTSGWFMRTGPWVNAPTSTNTGYLGVIGRNNGNGYYTHYGYKWGIDFRIV